MKKLLVAVLACALFAPAFAVENVKITGDVQTIGLRLEDNNVPGLMDLRGATTRVMLGIGVDLVEDVYAKITLMDKHSVGITDVNGVTINALQNRVKVLEGYVNISNVFDALEVKVGRQFYGDEKSAVIYFGPDYGYAVSNTAFSVDGATVTYNGDNLTATAAYFALDDGGASLRPTATPTHTDEKLAGLDLGYKFNEELSASAYVYDIRKYRANSFGFWGVKPTYESDNLKLGAEFARNYGAHDKGWLVKADAALPVELDDTTLTPRVTYLKTEKGFEAYGNYRPGLMFGTIYGNINGRLSVAGMSASPTNQYLDVRWEVINAGLCLKFAGLEKWGFGLDFYTAEMNNHFLGNSWEAKAVYNHNQYVALHLTGAVLTNRRHFTASPTAIQLGMSVKF